MDNLGNHYVYIIIYLSTVIPNSTGGISPYFTTNEPDFFKWLICTCKMYCGWKKILYHLGWLKPYK